MRAVPSHLDLEALRRELLQLSYGQDRSGVRMARRQGSPVPGWARVGSVATALQEIAQAELMLPVSVMANILPGSTCIARHRDEGNQGARWHLPVTTSPEVEFEIDGERQHLSAGSWHGPFPYWETHAVHNHSSADRLHLIVDLK